MDAWPEFTPYTHSEVDQSSNEWEFSLQNARYQGMIAPKRFLSVDPLADRYPSWSPYTYVLDNPINFIDPDGRLVVGDSADLATLAGQVNEWLTNNGIKDASLSVTPTKDKDGNPTFQLALKGTGWNDLANGDQAVTGLTMSLPFGNADPNVLATNALNHLGDVVRSETVIDLVYGETSSDGKSTLSGGVNSKGIHVGLAPGANLGVAMHELVGHGHPYYNSGWENDVGNVFGSSTRSEIHDGVYGRHWSKNRLGEPVGGGYAGYERHWFWGNTGKATFKMPSKLPRILKRNK